MQLDLFPPPPPPIPVAAPVERAPDPLAEKLVAAGLVPNAYLLDLNRGLQNDAWDGLPSRMYHFPIEFMDRSRRGDGESALLLYHPDLASLTFVTRVFELTGVMARWEPLDEFGRDRGFHRRYHHAVDLCTRKHWHDLLETRNLTDDDGLVVGARFAVTYNNVDTVIARKVLAAAGSDPIDASILDDAITVSADGKVMRPQFKFGLTMEQSVWAKVYAIEQGLVAHKDGHMVMTKAGLERIDLKAVSQ